MEKRKEMLSDDKGNEVHDNDQNINMNVEETPNNKMEMDDFGDNDVEMRDDEDEDDKNGHLFCPITHELMVDPVMLDDGHSYERTAIEEWLKDNDTSPNTGERLPSKKLRQIIV